MPSSRRPALRPAVDVDTAVTAAGSASDPALPPPPFKILVTGGPVVGKSTFLHAVSDLPPTADPGSAMEFGRATVPGGQRDAQSI